MKRHKKFLYLKQQQKQAIHLFDCGKCPIVKALKESRMANAQWTLSTLELQLPAD